MGILTNEFEATEMPISLLTDKTLIEMGFHKIGTDTVYARWELIKYGWRIRLTISKKLEVALVHIIRIRKSKTTGNSVTSRVSTMNELISIINKHRPRRTYESA